MSGAADFDAGRLVETCRAALAESSPAAAVREILTRAIERPSSVLRALGEPQRSEVQRIHVSDELTVINVLWGPRMVLMPHDHRMWAVIGVYTGREDNIFWRRLDAADGPQIEAAGARSLGPGEVLPLGTDVVHSVTNPVARLTGAIHVYGGDFFARARSEWDPETLREQPYDVDKNMRLFEASNARPGPV